MASGRGASAPLDELVAVAHDGIRHRLEELARRPPNPGVVEHLRERVALQLERSPLALRETAAHKVDDELRARLDDQVVEGRRLADRTRRGGLDDDAVHGEVLAHLQREQEVAAAIVASAGADAPALADAYGRTRDIVVYGL